MAEKPINTQTAPSDETSGRPSAIPHGKSELEVARHNINKAMEAFLEEHIGGEATEAIRIIRAQEPDRFSRVNSYWSYTLFAMLGRPFPLIPFFLFMIYSVGVCAFGVYYLGPEGVLATMKGQKPELKDVVSILGIAVFLVLSFRNNSAYQRWYEGASRYYELCGFVGNAARMVAAVAPAETGVQLLWWLVAVLFTAKQQLRSSRKVASYAVLEAVLPDEIWEELDKQHDKFHWALFRYGEIAAKMDLSGKTESKAAENVMMAAMGIHGSYTACWRILRTPFPFSYLTHLRVFLCLWLAMMPWAFIPSYGWYSLIICAFVSFGVLGIEESAAECEQPFGSDANDLPLDNIAHDSFEQIFNFICHIGFDEHGRSLSQAATEKLV